MFHCKLIPADNRLPAILQVSGEATIQNIQQFREALVEGLKAHSDLMVDCSKVTDVDVSCLQLLCSAHQTHQTLKLSPETLKSLMKVVEPAGFARLGGCCNVDDKQSCLWICNVPAAQGEDL